MVVEAGPASRAIGCSKRWRIRALTVAALAPGVLAGILGFLHFGQIISEGSAKAAGITMLGFAGLSLVTALASRIHQTAILGRLDPLARVFDISPEAMVLVGPDGTVIHANAAFDRLFPDAGRMPLERIKRALRPESETQPQYRQLFGRAAAGAHVTATVALSEGASGDPGRLEIAVDPVPGHAGHRLWKLRKVPAQLQVEGAIREAGDGLSDIVDNVPIGIYSVDGSGRFRYVNRTFAQWLGTTPSEMIDSGARLPDFVASAPAARQAAGKPLTLFSDAAHGEIVLKTAGGRMFPVWIGQTVATSSGILRTRSAACDLSPERERQTALRASERFRRCFTNAPVGIALLDRHGRVEEANQAVADLLGLPPQGLKTRELITLLNEEDRDRIAAKLTAIIEGRDTPEPIEVRPQPPSDRTMVLFLSRLDSAAGGAAAREPDPVGGLTAHFIDVTEQKNLEVQFAQSQKMQAVGQLAGGVAHDFNNLLTAMIGFCDLLLLRSPPGDPSFADIMQIKQNANRAANLVRQLLAFSRQQSLQPRVLNITDVLYELRHLLQRLIGENIRLEVVHGRDLGFAKVDQVQFDQVIINLAVNARDAMPGGGVLTITTANVHEEREARRGHETMPAGDYVMIEVRDSGVGIPKENLDRVFDPFFSTKELGSGTGLGLSTVYGIVKQTGGFVFVTSTPGRGSAFQIFLPRFPAAIEEMAARGDPNEAASVKDLTGSGTVMLVEDDDPVRIFGARALRNKGYNVIEATSGEAALDLIGSAAEKIDLLITDVVMPHMDGPGLVREVRELHPEMKVIFISGYTEDAFRQRLGSENGIDFLPKPFSLKQLAAKVRDVMAAGSV